MKPWGQLDRIVARLPRHSCYKAAIDDDEEFAAIASAMPKPEDYTPRVPLAGYSEVAARLDNVFDAINAVNETLVAIHTTKRGAFQRPNRAPRPETATQRIEARQRVERLDHIVNWMTGGR